MRSRAFRCRTGAIAPVLTVAEYALIRPAVPVIPGRTTTMPLRPPYVPVNAHYVNPPGTRPARGLAVAGGLAFAIALLIVAVWFMLALADAGPRPAPAPGFTTNPASVPTTYGYPPR